MKLRGIALPERGENSESFGHLINAIMKALQTNEKNTEDEISQEREIREEERVIVKEVEETTPNIEELREKLQAELKAKERLIEIANTKQEKRKIKECTVEEIQNEIKQVKSIQMIAGGLILSVVTGGVLLLMKK